MINTTNARLFFGDTEISGDVVFTEDVMPVDEATWKTFIPKLQEMSGSFTLIGDATFPFVVPPRTRLKFGDVTIEGHAQFRQATPPHHAKPTYKKIVRYLKAIGRYDVYEMTVTQ